MMIWCTKFVRNAFNGPEINGNPIVYIGDLTFEIRHQNTRELPLKEKLNLYQIGDPIKRHTDLLKYGYIIIV